MALDFQQLLKDIGKIDLEDISSSWQWLLHDQKSVILVSSVGDMFLIGKNNAINWLDTSLGKLEKVADSLDAFEQLMKEEENIDNWFLAALVEELIQSGKTLRENEVYSFIKLPVFGGDYSADNLETLDVSVHFNITGQIHEQIKDLPGGTVVNDFKFNI